MNRSLIHRRSRLRIVAAAAMIASWAAVTATAAEAHKTSAASGRSPFADGCDGVPPDGSISYRNAEVEPFAAVNPTDKRNLVGVWQQDRWNNGGSHGLGTGYSFDGGRTWNQVYVPFSICAGGKAGDGNDYQRASDPWVSFSANGVAHMMGLAIDHNSTPGKPSSAMLASRSVDGGKTWSQPIVLQADTDKRFNDKNTITADPTDSRYVYAVWDRLSSVAGEGAGPTLLARSVDNGASWKRTKIIFDPGQNAQTIANRIEVLPDGTLVNVFLLIDYLTGTASHQVIRSTDKGMTWSAPIKVADDLSVGTFDPDTGKPVRSGSGLPQMAVSPSGTIYIVAADGRFSGGEYDGVMLTQSSDGGLTWSEPVQVNGEPSVQAFTPSVHVRADGTVGVSYYDFRENTTDTQTLPTTGWLATSIDGVNWSDKRIAVAFELNKAPVAGGLFLGDYQGLVSVGNKFSAFMVKTTGGDGLRNRTDAFSKLSNAAMSESWSYRALPAAKATSTVSEAWRQRTWRNVLSVARDRLPDWAQPMVTARAGGQRP